jgi:hypothetical protein
MNEILITALGITAIALMLLAFSILRLYQFFKEAEDDKTKRKE